MAPTRVLLFGTHPNQFNGYSKVVYELTRRLARDHSGEVTMGVFGFQGLQTDKPVREPLPDGVMVHDAHKHEEPKRQGFGIEQVLDVVERFQPDACVIYNDVIVITEIIKQLIKSPRRPTFKIIVYLDQVYAQTRKVFIQVLNQHADAVIAFTPAWQDCIREQGLTVPALFNLPHGYDDQTYFPIPRKLARDYLQLSGTKEDFVVLNLNRNQPRKRWDTCLKALAEVLHRRPGAPIKLLIATEMVGSWDLLEIYERELKKRDITLDKGLEHLIILDAPQRLSDADVNILYNVADIGLNTCDGEGFGLCNFEQALVGVPQVVPRLGGFVEFLDDSCALMVDPILAYYVDNTRDMACGEAQLSDYRDFAEAILRYYDDRTLVRTHGQRARERIVKSGRFTWSAVARRFVDIVQKVTDVKVSPLPSLVADTLLDKVVTKGELNQILGVRKPPKKRRRGVDKSALAKEVAALKHQLQELKAR
jgi:glycosyltransferase involved in cell wall biosynthesis